jgi:hypothetical protein
MSSSYGTLLSTIINNQRKEFIMDEEVKTCVDLFNELPEDERRYTRNPVGAGRVIVGREEASGVANVMIDDSRARPMSGMYGNL